MHTNTRGRQCIAAVSVLLHALHLAGEGGRGREVGGVWMGWRGNGDGTGVLGGAEACYNRWAGVEGRAGVAESGVWGATVHWRVRWQSEEKRTNNNTMSQHL